MQKFYLDSKFFCTYKVISTHSFYSHLSADQITPDELVKILKDEDKFHTISQDDHEEFTKLRKTLEERGLIKTHREWHNMDTVKETFVLNDAVFNVDDTFPCAGAMPFTINLKLKHP